MVHPAYLAGVAARYGLGAWAAYRTGKRISMAFKRGRSDSGVAFGRPSKRGRFMRRRFRRRGRKNVLAWNAEKGSTYSIRFRKRRIRPRRWRRMIYRETESQTHWRSVFATSAFTDPGNPAGTVLNTPNNLTQVNVAFCRALARTAVPEHFWDAGGGAQPKDFGGVVPAFSGDAVIRGGYARVTIAPTLSDTEALFIRVYAVWAPNLNGLAAEINDLQVTKSKDWEPSVFPDFTKIGKILYSRETIARPGDNPFTVVHRLKPQKVDRNRFQAGHLQLWWLIMVGKASETEAVPTAKSVSVTRSFNMSFVMDTNTGA